VRIWDGNGTVLGNEQWKINILAGVVVEQAFRDFSGYFRAFPMKVAISNGTTRLTVPDFFHQTIKDILYPNGALEKQIRFDLGGIVEVKCPQNPIDISTNNYQIEAEINIAAQAKDYSGKTTASQEEAASYTLVLPAGTKVNQSVIDYANKMKVNLFFTYTFVNRLDKTIVFTNPTRLNYISGGSNTESYGNLDNRAKIDIGKAAQRFQYSNDGKDD
jgi:hypothetical protein